MSARRCCRATARRSEGARDVGRPLSRALLSRGAARRTRRRRRARRRDGARSPRELALPVVATHPVQFLRREDFRAHEARVCIAEGHVLADPRRPKRFTPEQYFKSQAEMADALRRSAGGARQLGRDRAALQFDDPARQEFPAGLSRRRRASRSTSTCATKPQLGLERRLAMLYPDARGARREASALRRAARLRDRHHRADGLRRLLPDRRRFHQLGEGERRAGRTGARLGRRLAGRVFARHHRPRSAALRPAVRALPQSRARVDAGLRHRLLPGRPRSRDRLRQEEIRRRFRVADRDVRHDGGEGRGARRRARARLAIHASATASPSSSPFSRASSSR